MTRIAYTVSHANPKPVIVPLFYQPLSSQHLARLRQESDKAESYLGNFTVLKN